MQNMARLWRVGGKGGGGAVQAAVGLQRSHPLTSTISMSFLLVAHTCDYAFAAKHPQNKLARNVISSRSISSGPALYRSHITPETPAN